MENNLAKLVNVALPSVSSNGSITYNADKNIFLTGGYTSQTGNTYFQGVRLSDRIIITLQLGQGYAYTFLNGIRIFGFNGQKTQLISEQSFHCETYNEVKSKNYSIEMIQNYLCNQGRLSGQYVDNSTILSFARTLVEATLKNQLETIKQLSA